ncbi:hypothetical protein [uncultured Subdoligranulum sp.]|uniref:hypothetical protein n=1 Tax=uncultured Subdoligranulum sp. TaxID=512298 RepID=UPI0025E9453B|nr:hypothetical protein [uncultured Subdoligranulum sp.]
MRMLCGKTGERAAAFLSIADRSKEAGFVRISPQNSETPVFAKISQIVHEIFTIFI